jgi:DNA-directed RNA polymerase specialized sigma subunit
VVNIERQDKDMQLFAEWQKTNSKDAFQKLYRGFGGLINNASQKAAYNSQVPQSVFKLEAAQQFHDALQRFDPKHGVKLSTYLHGTIENKLKRINYKYQNMARISERSGQGLGIYHINDLNNAKEILRQKLNREPTHIEIAKEMNVQPEHVQKLEQEIRKDLSLNADLEDLVSFDDLSAEKATLSMHYYDLNPEEQQVFDYGTGDHGKPKIVKPNGNADYKRIGAMMNIPESRAKRLGVQMANRIHKVQHGAS